MGCPRHVHCLSVRAPEAAGGLQPGLATKAGPAGVFIVGHPVPLGTLRDAPFRRCPAGAGEPLATGRGVYKPACSTRLGASPSTGLHEKLSSRIKAHNVLPFVAQSQTEGPSLPRVPLVPNEVLLGLRTQTYACPIGRALRAQLRTDGPSRTITVVIRSPPGAGLRQAPPGARQTHSVGRRASPIRRTNGVEALAVALRAVAIAD